MELIKPIELSKHAVAEMVRERLQNRHPSGLTIEVVEDDIRKMDTWWQVPVRPDNWPEKTFEYYDTLAEVETQLLEDKHINILLAPSEPISDTYTV